MDEIRAMLAWFYEPAQIDEWLSMPNPCLGGAVANDLIAAGQTAQVRAVVQRLADGAYI